MRERASSVGPRLSRHPHRRRAAASGALDVVVRIREQLLVDGQDASCGDFHAETINKQPASCASIGSCALRGDMQRPFTLRRDKNANDLTDVRLQPGTSDHLHKIGWKDSSKCPPFGAYPCPFDDDRVRRDVDAPCMHRDADELAQVDVSAVIIH